MEVTRLEHDGLSVITVRGRCDGADTVELERQCALVLANGAVRVVFDLGEAVSISATGLESIVATSERLARSGGRAAVCSTSADVAERLAARDTGRRVPVVGGLAAAVRALR